MLNGITAPSLLAEKYAFWKENLESLQRVRPDSRANRSVHCETRRVHGLARTLERLAPAGVEEVVDLVQRVAIELRVGFRCRHHAADQVFDETQEVGQPVVRPGVGQARRG